VTAHARTFVEAVAQSALLGALVRVWCGVAVARASIRALVRGSGATAVIAGCLAIIIVAVYEPQSFREFLAARICTTINCVVSSFIAALTAVYHTFHVLRDEAVPEL
jgi:hypothetical protein